MSAPPPPVIDTVPTTVPPLVVEIVGDGGTDWSPFISAGTAVAVVLIGAWLASRRLRRQIEEARTDADMRWQREQASQREQAEHARENAEARWQREQSWQREQWLLAQKRDVYSRCVSDADDAIKAANLMMRSYRGGTLDDEPQRPSDAWEAAKALHKTYDEARLIATDEVLTQLRTIRDYVGDVLKAVQSDDTAKCDEVASQPGNCWTAFHVLVRVAREEVST